MLRCANATYEKCSAGDIISLSKELNILSPKPNEARIMSIAKSEVKALLDTLPEDSSLEDVQYHLYVLEKIKAGMNRANSEGALTHDEVSERMGKWIAE